MDDYRWFDYQHLSIDERFAQLPWINGAREWARPMSRFPFPTLLAANQFLDSLRQLPRIQPTCPRLFVSHRQTDEDLARRIAWLAWDEGFDYWLDVIDLDPALNGQIQQLEQRLSRPLTPFEKSVLTAGIIEMALLNCTHVLAVMTTNTAGSQWVPYEYGRTKQNAPVTLQACCWHSSALQKHALPEYLHLGPIHDSEREIRRWLKSEKRSYHGCPGTQRGTWPDPVPAEL